MNPSGSYLPGKNPYGHGHGGKTSSAVSATVTSTSTLSKTATATKSYSKVSHSSSYSTGGSATKTSTTASVSGSQSSSASYSSGSQSASSAYSSPSSGSQSSSASLSIGSNSASPTITSTSSYFSYSQSSASSSGPSASPSGSQSSSSSSTVPQSYSSGTVTSSSSSITSSASLSASTTSSSSTSSSSSSASALPSCYYWLENIDHQGISAFGPSDYAVFRNVKDYGAKGDGVTDDTAAINAAISDGGRCAPGSCASSTLTPAVVYFPAGTYIVSAPIIDYYMTQIVGNPNCMPTIKASSGFSGAWVIDGDQYQAGGVLGFGSTNIFWRQIRNFIIDMTSVSASSALVGIHWPTAQATSLQNIVFMMSEAPGTQHEGVYIESGSGGFMTDLVFYGGNIAAYWGNQQFTTRNLTFYNAVTAINQLWDWGWTYKGITIDNCTVGLNISGLNNGAQAVGSVILIDSTISNTDIGISTVRTPSDNNPATGGSAIFENVVLNNVDTAIQGPTGNTILAGGSLTIAAFGQGNAYIPTGPNAIQQPITPNSRPGSLTSGGAFYERSKPQYSSYSASSFVSARSFGATGDGTTDDTSALQAAIDNAASSGLIVFADAGTYLVTDTIKVPAGSKIVGESYSVIMSSGSTFSDINNPVPVVQVGEAGDSGIVEWSDMIVSTQGAQAGAILIEWNLAAPASSPGGLWDVHARIGGFAGSKLQLENCPTDNTTTYTASNIDENCIAAFMSMHVTPSASGLYLENVWLWTADHDVEDPNVTQITVYTGRGLYVESTAGTIWLYGTAVEHHSLCTYSSITLLGVLTLEVFEPVLTLLQTSTNSPTRKTSTWAKSKPKHRTTSPTPTLQSTSALSLHSTTPSSPNPAPPTRQTHGVFASSRPPTSSSTAQACTASSTTTTSSAVKLVRARCARTASSPWRRVRTLMCIA